MEKFIFQKIRKKQWIKNGLRVGKKHGTVSRRSFDELDLYSWKKFNLHFDFNNMALGLERDDSRGNLVFHKNKCFSTMALSTGIPRGRYLFITKQDNLLVFKYSPSKEYAKGGEKT